MRASFRSLATLAVCLFAAVSAHALQGSIDFTAAEKARHLQGLPVIIKTTTESMRNFAEEHFRSHDACGIGLLYGFKSGYSKLTSDRAKEDWIRARATCANPPRVEDVNITSCEIYTNRHLEKGFAAAGQSDLFNRIDRYFNLNGRTGIALAFALQKLGWRTAYWNTDVAVRHPTPEDRAKMGATPDDHVYSYVIARKKRTYYEVPIEGWLINFAPSPGSSTKADTSALRAFKQAPYFIGIAHGGFHVFPGYYGTVNESHSPHNPNLAKNIEVGEFGPPYGSPQGLTATVNGQRKLVHYHSGMIVLPPGEWVWF